MRGHNPSDFRHEADSPFHAIAKIFRVHNISALAIRNSVTQSRFHPGNHFDISARLPRRETFGPYKNPLQRMR